MAELSREDTRNLFALLLIHIKFSTESQNKTNQVKENGRDPNFAKDTDGFT